MEPIPGATRAGDWGELSERGATRAGYWGEPNDRGATRAGYWGEPSERFSRRAGVVGALDALRLEGKISAEVVARAINELGLATDKVDPASI